MASLIKIGQAYRIKVKFDKALTTITQLRELCKKLSTKNTVIVQMSPYEASIIAVFTPGSKPELIQYDRPWFRVGASTAIVKLVTPEVTFTR